MRTHKPTKKKKTISEARQRLWVRGNAATSQKRKEKTASKEKIGNQKGGAQKSTARVRKKAGPQEESGPASRGACNSEEKELSTLEKVKERGD